MVYFSTDNVQKKIRKRAIRTITGLGRFYRKSDSSGTGVLFRFELEKGLFDFHIDMPPEVYNRSTIVLTYKQLMYLRKPRSTVVLTYKQHMYLRNPRSTVVLTYKQLMYLRNPRSTVVLTTHVLKGSHQIVFTNKCENSNCLHHPVCAQWCSIGVYCTIQTFEPYQPVSPYIL